MGLATRMLVGRPGARQIAASTAPRAPVSPSWPPPSNGTPAERLATAARSRPCRRGRPRPPRPPLRPTHAPRRAPDAPPPRNAAPPPQAPQAAANASSPAPSSFLVSATLLLSSLNVTALALDLDGALAVVAEAVAPGGAAEATLAVREISLHASLHVSLNDPEVDSLAALYPDELEAAAAAIQGGVAEALALTDTAWVRAEGKKKRGHRLCDGRPRRG